MINLLFLETGIGSRSTIRKLRTFCNDVANVSLALTPIQIAQGSYAIDESVFIKRKVRNVSYQPLIIDFKRCIVHDMK